MLISIIGIVVVLGVVIFSHEMGHFLMAKKMGVRIEVFSLGFGPKLWSVKKGDTEYKVCLVPFGGYVKMAGEEPGERKTGAEWEFSSKPPGKRFNIVVMGAVVNYLLGFLLLCAVFMMGAPVPTSHIGEVMEGYPAEKAGLRKNDKIIEIDGKNIKYWDEVTSAIHDKKGENINIVVDRGGKPVSFDLRGRTEEQKDIFGKPVQATFIGIRYSDEVDFVKYGFLESVEMGARTAWNMTAMTYKSIWYLLTGAMSIKHVAGPIGILAITGQAAQKGIVHLLWIGAVINIAIAIFNLLPFPVLDGGHILFIVIEKIKGRPIDQKVQEIAQQAALVLIIALFLVISWNDITGYFIK